MVLSPSFRMTYFSHLFGKLAPRLAHLFAIFFCTISLALLLLLAAANVLLAQMTGRLSPIIQQQMEQTLGRAVRVGSVHMAGWGTLLIADSSVANGATFQDGTALTVPQTLAHINLFSLLWNGGKNPATAIDEIVLRQPVAIVRRDVGGNFDFQDIVNRLRQRSSTSGVRAWMKVEGGDVTYQDARGFGAAPRAFSQHFKSITASFSPLSGDGIAFVASGADAPQLTGTVRLAGYYQPRAGRARIQMQTAQIDVRALSNYLPKKLPITFEDGTAALRLSALLTNLPTPDAAHTSPSTTLVAEADLRGVGLRLPELTAPIVATSGRLRLVHDTRRFPQGSQLEFIDVHARANNVPLVITGSINELNLLDLAHVNPLFDIHASLTTRDGQVISRLFPASEWMHALTLNGPVALDGHIGGHPADLRIDGTLTSRQFAVGGLRADGVKTAFTVIPSGAAMGVPTLRATASVRQLSSASASLDNLTLNISSATPWRELDTSANLTGAVSAGQVRLPWITLNGVQGQLTATNSGVAVEQMRAGVFGGQTIASVSFPFASQHGVAQAQATFSGIDAAQVAQIFHLSAIAGHADGSLSLALQPDGSLTAQARLTSSDAAFHGYAAAHFDATVQLTNGRDGLRVTIPRATATTAYGIFSATDGIITRGGTGPAVLAGVLHGEKIPLAMFGDRQEYSGLATLDGTVSGDLLSPTLTAHVTAANGKLTGKAFTAGQTDMTYQVGGALRFRNVSLSRPDMDVALAGGINGFDPRDGMTGQDATLHLHGATLPDVLALFGQDCPLRVDGGVQGTVQLHFGDSGVMATGDAAIANAVVHIPRDADAYPLDLRRIALAFDYADRAIAVRSLQLERGNTTIIATGSAACPLGSVPILDLAYRTDGMEMGDVPHELISLPFALTGTTDARGTLTGAIDGNGYSPLTLTMAATSPNAAADGFPLGKGDTALTYSYRPNDRQLAFDHLTFAKAAFQARAAGRVLLSRETLDGVTLNVTLDKLSALSSLLAQWSPDVSLALPNGLDGTVTLTLQADGSTAHPALRADIGMRDAVYNETSLPNLHAALTGVYANDAYQMTLADATLTDQSGTTLAQANGIVSGDGGPNLTFSAHHLTAKTLAPWIMSRLPVGGAADIQGTLRGTWHNPVVETDVAIDQPSYGPASLQRVAGHLRLTRDDIALSGGQAWFTAGAAPATVIGSVPWQWDGLTPHILLDQPFTLNVTVPSQNLASLRALAPSFTMLSGAITGSLSLDGTLSQPVLREGQLQVAGNIGLPNTAAGNPNQLDNLDLRIRAESGGNGITLAIDRLTAALNRSQHGITVKGFQPGAIAAAGSVRIPIDALRDPRQWGWDVYATLARLPLDARTFLVSQASGYLHLGTAANGPELNGVLLVQNTKISKPTLSAGVVPQWGPFHFNPRLNVLVQVGDAVKMKSGIFSVPLLPTPLERPAIPADAPSDVDRAQPAFTASADQARAATIAELPGTWGTITGTLNDPSIYARFEVAKKQLSFPLSLFSAIRHARGHVTYTRANGPQIVMGIPDLPVQTASR